MLLRKVRMQFFHHIAYQTATAQQVAAQLFNELLKTRFPLRPRRVLIGFGNRRADGQVIADIQRQRFNQDGLVTLPSRIHMGFRLRLPSACEGKMR